MTPRALHRLALFDVVGMALYVQWYIWDLQFRAPRSWMVFPLWLAASFLLHRDTPKSLGWRADNLWPATRNALLVFAIFSAALAITAFALGTIHPLPPNSFSPRRLWLYFAFCLLQQVGLQSFFNNRLTALISRRWFSSVLAGIIFGISHWPNPVLVPVTIVGGTAMAWLFARERNVIPLAVGQALLGALVWACFPLEWHHRMRVGPGYFRPF